MNIIGRMKIWFLISGITICAGIAAISIYKPQYGIDFTGGSLLELAVPATLTKEVAHEVATDSKIEVGTITTSDNNVFLIRTKPITESDKNVFLTALKSKVGESAEAIEERRFETIGPTVSADLVKKALISVILASFAIIAYIAFVFRKLPDHSQSWRFGITAVVALMHDLLVTIGIFTLVGHFLGWEIDSLFITALLTVMGFSVHDTIVVFDRIRENVRRFPDHSFSNVSNESVVQTLGRSLNTSMTILITLATLLFLGGSTLQPFVFTLIMGILVGTYSSIFTATPLLVVWQNNVDKKRSHKV
ncbi:protein translocase subunit SecF [Candidatus Berkelbacteria bacterium CG06_land_8_20_14_3_00_43_10]|uniref:Protein-export membrane protein SecF n=1 Tax=Candidatus Berkelbacteria bacterium CG10_big_fil_rev_8_21_14_0_10_43_14 TaxID=1974515 RepID=A0A2M6R847_9BACT|nr:MAG: protein-export membrane protein SecF [Candidatus Berkelbacteria bacterium CG2_30_43_20]PIS06732.1 MAG: protein translocase subunit SecF [Candidatus Berkelbacteria bacterium CG10_big_fil_rev_8_21_14_0_10_43_14]PIU87531.1 MAG: protein translocase subunit SecF [Candidatus Berkelbacteria bacterium CG06_land_8_20_14_3_00_43_10]